MGDASRADRYSFLVDKSGVEGVEARVGLLPDDKVRQLRKGRIRLSHRRERTKLALPSPLPNRLLILLR